MSFNIMDNTTTKKVFKISYSEIFKFFYPENEINIEDVKIIKDKAIICARFPDGIFYFIVGKNWVSSCCNSYSEAINRLEENVCSGGNI